MAKTGVPFDRNLPFGTLHGVGTGAAYTQTRKDGVERHYRPDGARVLLKGQNLEAWGEPAPKAAAPADKAAVKPVGKMGEGKPTGRAAKMKHGTTAATEGKLDLNQLRAWAKGEEPQGFEAVQAAIKAHFDVEVGDETEAAVVLVENGALAGDEVKVSA